LTPRNIPGPDIAGRHVESNRLSLDMNADSRKAGPRLAPSLVSMRAHPWTPRSADRV